MTFILPINRNIASKCEFIRYLRDETKFNVEFKKIVNGFRDFHGLTGDSNTNLNVKLEEQNRNNFGNDFEQNDNNSVFVCNKETHLSSDRFDILQFIFDSN